MPQMNKEALQEKLRHMQLALEPIFQLPAGEPHPQFPETMLQFNLLTEELLDSFAHYYHQAEYGEYTFEYPDCMGWDVHYFDTLDIVKRVAVKRRKFGKFIGLRGCQTPTEELAARLELLETRTREAAQAVSEQEEAARKMFYRHM